MEQGRSGRKIILLKIGTATLTRGTQTISRGKIEDIARQIVKLKDKFDFIIVSSGAIAAAKQFINLERIGDGITAKQALAAIGQPYLMRLIQECFRELNLHVAQCLLSYHDFQNEDSKENTINTINVLISNGIIPIINENDTVATDEIKFGDNDKLAAMTAGLMNVDLLILATNTNGIYDQNEDTVVEIDDIEDARKYIQDRQSEQGTGGMESKLEAASIAQKHGILTWLLNGHEDDFMIKAFEKKSMYTIIK